MARAPLTDYGGGTAIEWALVLQAATFEPVLFRQTAGGFGSEAAGATAFPADQWVKWAVTFDAATRVVSLYVNGAVTYTKTVAADIVSTVGSELTFGAATGIQANGSVASAYYYVGRCLTAPEVATLGGGGAVGLRWGQVPPALRTGLKGWWDFGESAAVTTETFANQHDPTRPFLSTALGVPLDWETPPVDPVITAAVGGGPEGGADLTVFFKAGSAWRGTPLTIDRPGVTVTRYGSGTDPLISGFSETFAAGGWTLVSGTSYKRAAATEIGWLLKPSEECVTTAEVLSIQLTSAQVQATANSFGWIADNGGELHVNAGADPDTVSPSGYLGAAVGLACLFGTDGSVDNLRVQQVRFAGWAMTRPGQGGGHAISLTLDAGEEAVFAAVTSVQSGYHSLTAGISGGGAVTILVGKYGLCQNRREGGDVTPAAGANCNAIACNGGGYEFLELDSAIVTTAQPSISQTPGSAGGGGIICHGDRVAPPAEMICLIGTRYAAGVDMDPSSYADMGDLTVAATPDACRAWLIGETTGVSGQIALSLQENVACIDARNATAIAPGSGYVLAPPVGLCWLANASVLIDADGVGTVDILGNLPPGASGLQVINGEFRVLNGTTVNLTTPAQASRLTADFNVRNTLIATPGASATTLGSADATDLTHCAEWDFDLAGTTAPVALASDPGYRPTGVAALLGAGTATGAMEYDQTGTVRATPPAIGARE